MARVILNGEPGEVWTNGTDKLQYQMIVSFHNSCGTCVQYHHAIGSYWPIPFHRGCRCYQIPIEPGESARPFADFREEIDKLDRVQQSRVVGRSNLTLIDEGVVTWDDVVTRSRVRDFNEVVATKKLTVDEMVRAGVKPHIAEQAYASVHTPAHQLAEQQRRRLVESITSKGVSRQQLRESLGKGIASRVGITGGGGGPQAMPIPPTPVKPKPVPKAPTPKIYGPSKATFAFDADNGQTSEGIRKVAAGILGRADVSEADLAGLTGATDGATITIDYFSSKTIIFRIKHSNYDAKRILSRTESGAVITNGEFKVKTSARGKGLGAEVFGRQVEEAARLGVKSLNTFAAGSKKNVLYNGYYTWPRFGYDGPLPARVVSQLQSGEIPGPPVKSPQKVSDLMATEQGRQWWKEYGYGVDLTFDPTPGSDSRQLWDQYLIEKAKAKKP